MQETEERELPIEFDKDVLSQDFLIQTYRQQQQNQYIEFPQPLETDYNYYVIYNNKHDVLQFKYIVNGLTQNLNDASLLFLYGQHKIRIPMREIYNGGDPTNHYIIHAPNAALHNKKTTLQIDPGTIGNRNLFNGGGFYYNKRTKKSKKNKIHDSLRFGLRFGKQPKALKSKKSKRNKKNKNYWSFHYKRDY